MKIRSRSGGRNYSQAKGLLGRRRSNVPKRMLSTRAKHRKKVKETPLTNRIRDVRCTKQRSTRSYAKGRQKDALIRSPSRRSLRRGKQVPTVPRKKLRPEDYSGGNGTGTTILALYKYGGERLRGGGTNLSKKPFQPNPEGTQKNHGKCLWKKKKKRIRNPGYNAREGG